MARIKLSMTLDAGKQAADSWLHSRAESKDRAIKLGFPTIDTATPKAYGGQNIMVMGLKGHGKSPLLNNLAARYSTQFSGLPDMDLDEKQNCIVLIRGEETIERTAIMLTNMMTKSRLSMLKLSSGSGKALEAFRKNMLDPRSTGLPVHLIGRTVNKSSSFTVGGEKWNSALDIEAIDQEFDDINSSQRIAVTITDYLQCLKSFRRMGGGENGKFAEVQSVCDWFLNLQNRMDAVNLIGVQCNVKEVTKRSPWDQIPRYGDSYYTQDLDHQVDGGLAVFRPISSAYPHKYVRLRKQTFYVEPPEFDDEDDPFDALNTFHNGGLEKTGRDITIPERYIKVTQDLFLIKVLSWRECGASGIVIPVSGRGGNINNPFGQFTEIPFDEAQTACEENIPESRMM